MQQSKVSLKYAKENCFEGSLLLALIQFFGWVRGGRGEGWGWALI